MVAKLLEREGWMYVSFLQDGFSRHILEFAVRPSKGTELVTRALLQVVNVRQRSSASFVANCQRRDRPFGRGLAVHVAGVRREAPQFWARWVAWLNRDPLHAETRYLTPSEMESAYVQEQGLPRQAA